MSSQAKLLKFIIDNLFPKDAGLLSAFGYGSVVFPQHGRTTANSQLDLLLIVKDPMSWHLRNIERNPLHYSSLTRMVDSYVLKKILRIWPSPAVYYNPLITWSDATGNFPPQLLKYGVIGYNCLLQDLNCWTDLYVAGRLHKPVFWVPGIFSCNGESSELKSSLHRNLKSSLAFSVLQHDFINNEVLQEDTLYRYLASISYHGDWRLYFGEDRKKIMRLVTGESRKLAFRDLYLPILTSAPFFEIFSFDISSENELKISYKDRTLASRGELLMCLPDAFCLRATDRREDVSSARNDLLHLEHSQRASRLADTAASIVRRASYSQTLLGLFSAGLSRSVTYSFEKLRKMVKSF